MSTLVQMADPRALVLSCLKVLMMPATPFNSSTATTGKAVNSKSARTVTLVALPAVLVEATDVEASVAVEASAAVSAAAEVSEVVEVSEEAMAEVDTVEAAAAAVGTMAVPPAVLRLLPRTHSPTMPPPARIRARSSMFAT